jgi:hypothetical protein
MDLLLSRYNECFRYGVEPPNSKLSFASARAFEPSKRSSKEGFRLSYLKSFGRTCVRPTYKQMTLPAIRADEDDHS